MNNEIDSNVTLRYTLDQAALTDLLRGNDALIGKLSDLQSANDAVTQSALDATRSLGNIQDALDASVQDSITETKKAENAWQAIGDAIQSDTDKLEAFRAKQAELTAQSVAQQSGYGVSGGMTGPAEPPDDGGGSFSPYGLARGLRIAGFATKSPLLSEAGGGIYIAQSIQQITPLFDKLGDTLQNAAGPVGALANAGAELGPSLLGVSASMGAVLAIAAPVAAAIGVGVIAYEAFNATVNDGRQAVEGALVSLDAYYKAIQEGTTETVDKELSAIQIKLNADQEYLNQLQSGRTIHDAGDVVRNALSSVFAPEIPEKIRNLADEMKHLQSESDGLTRALDSTAIAMNNARDADEKAFKQKADNNLKEAEDQVQYSEHRLQLIKNGNVAAVDAEIEHANQQKTIQEDAIRYLQGLEAGIADPAERAKYDAAINGYKVSNAELSFQINDLTSNVLPLTKVTAEATATFKGLFDAISKVPGALNDIVDTVNKASENQQKFDTETADRTAAFNLKQSREQTDFNTKIAQSDKDHDTKRTQELNALYAEADKITSTASVNELKATQELSDKTARINQDLADKIAEIQNKAREDELDAASHLDARKIAQLQRQANDQIAKDTEQADKQKAQLAKDTEDKIKELQKSAEAERTQRLEAGLQKIQDEDDQYALQRQREIDANDLKMQREREDETTQDAQRLSAFQNQQRSLSDHLEQMLGIQNNKQGLIRDAWNQLLNDLKTSIGQLSIPAPTVTTAQYQAAQTSANPDAYSQFQTSYTAQQAPSVTNTQFQTAQTGSPDAYSNLLGASAAAAPNNALLGSLTSAGSSILGAGSSLAHLIGIPGFVNGGDPQPGQSFMAGEGGLPELITLHHPATVYNNADTQRMMSGGKTITVEKIEINGTNLSAQELQSAIRQGLLDYVNEEAEAA